MKIQGIEYIKYIIRETTLPSRSVKHKIVHTDCQRILVLVELEEIHNILEFF